MKKFILLRKLLKPIKPLLVLLFEIESSISKSWVSSSHKRLYLATWGIQPTPENFDHQIDLYYVWPEMRWSYWLERGVFGNLAIKSDGDILELACGDGFNARFFYSNKAKSIIACDFDPEIISTAKRKNKLPKITYILSDIRFNMPDGSFDNIIWDAAIEHFTIAEIHDIIINIKKRLFEKKGILCGHTIAERPEGKSLKQHEYEFKDMADLERLLKQYFKNVIVFETIYEVRHNLYFWASEGTIPFTNEWGHWLKS